MPEWLLLASNPYSSLVESDLSLRSWMFRFHIYTIYTIMTIRAGWNSSACNAKPGSSKGSYRGWPAPCRAMSASLTHGRVVAMIPNASENNHPVNFHVRPNSARVAPGASVPVTASRSARARATTGWRSISPPRCSARRYTSWHSGETGPRDVYTPVVTIGLDTSQIDYQRTSQKFLPH